MSTIELNENNKTESSYYTMSNSNTSTDQINNDQNNVSISSDNENNYLCDDDDDDDEDHRNSIDAEIKENHDSSNDNLVAVNENDGDNELLSEKPTILKLHATSASMVHNNKHRHPSTMHKSMINSTTTALSSLSYDHFSLSNGNLESLLQQTKVIELNANGRLLFVQPILYYY